MSLLSGSVSIVSKSGAPLEESDPFPFSSVATGKLLGINPQNKVAMRYIGAETNSDANKNDSVFSALRDWRTFTKKKYSDSFVKLSPGSKVILLELYLFKSDEEMDDNTFAVLKVFYATLVSKNRMELCMRAWTDPEN